jgi:fructose-bisphosphate aldolase class II
MTTAIREHLAAHPDVVDSRKYLRVAREAMVGSVTQLITVVRGGRPGQWGRAAGTGRGDMIAGDER